MNLITLLFSFNGRMSRAKYRLALLIWGGIWIIAAYLLLNQHISEFLIDLIVFVFLLSATSNLSISIRRLHDINKSGWWLVPTFFFPILLAQFGRSMGGTWYILSGVAAGVTIWAFIELTFVSGTVGPNRYGDDPLRPVKSTFH